MASRHRWGEPACYCLLLPAVCCHLLPALYVNTTAFGVTHDCLTATAFWVTHDCLTATAFWVTHDCLTATAFWVTHDCLTAIAFWVTHDCLTATTFWMTHDSLPLDSCTCLTATACLCMFVCLQEASERMAKLLKALQLLQASDTARAQVGGGETL